MKKIKLFSGEIIEFSGEPIFRGVFDPCNGVANVEMQVITKDGAVSIWFEYVYKNNTWTDQEVMDFGFSEIEKIAV